MKVIIIGCNRVGAELACKLDAQGHQVTVLDRSLVNLSHLPPSFKGTALQISELTEDILEQAGIKEAQVFAALTDEDNYNLLAGQLAKTLFNVPKVICSLNDPNSQELYENMGLEIINPITLLVQEITRKLSS